MTHKFLSPEEFNATNNIKLVNCLGYAFGQTQKGDYTLYRAVDFDTYRPLNPADTPVEAFIKKAAEFGFNVKQVTTPEETIGHTAFWLWGWFSYYDMFEHLVKHDDFHVVRKNTDGTFVHKPDDIEPASIIEDFGEFCKKYYAEDTPYIFVLI